VLRERFEEPESDPTVWVEVDSAQVRRTVVALRVMAPNALRPIEDIIPIVYPGVRISYGEVQSMAAEAEAQAALFNAKADLAGVRAGALDELFSQGEPVLAGVDLDSGYVFGLAVRETRGGADWAEVLTQGQEQGLTLAVVVKDAAKGIEAGVREVFPQAEQRDDCFHALYELNKVRRRLEQRAYRAIAAEEEARHRLPKISISDRKQRRCQRHRIARAHRHCQETIARFDCFLHSAEEVKARVEHAANTLQGLDPLCHQVARYLRNRAAGLALATGELNTRLGELATTYTLEAVALACMLWRWVFELHNDRRPWLRAEQHRQLLGAFAYLKHRLGPQLDALLAAVKTLLDQRHRASSAIEGFNAAPLVPFSMCTRG
jgi:hypothetical protein